MTNCAWVLLRGAKGRLQQRFHETSCNAMLRLSTYWPEVTQKGSPGSTPNRTSRKTIIGLLSRAGCARIHQRHGRIAQTPHWLLTKQPLRSNRSATSMRKMIAMPYFSFVWFRGSTPWPESLMVKGSHTREAGSDQSTTESGRNNRGLGR